MTTASRRWLYGCVGGLALLIANGSLLYGLLATPPGTRFIGIRTLLPADPPVYYSYLRQVQDGALTLRDIFTAEPQPVGTINVLWLTLGVAGRLLQLPPAVTFHVLRVLLGVLLLVVLYRGIGWFLSDWCERLAAFALVLSGGVGLWLVPFLPPAEYLDRGAGYRWPVDLWLPWSSPMLSLGSSPHLVASWALLVAAVLLAARGVEARSWRFSWGAGVTAALLLNFHPYHWPTLLAIPGCWLLLRFIIDRRLPVAALPYLLPLLLGMVVPLAYHAWLLSASPVAAARALQNVSRLPPWPYVVAGLGLVVPLAAATALTFFRTHEPRRWWAAAWLVAAFGLVVWPSQFQARYLQGMLVPLAVVAAPAAIALAGWVWRRTGMLGSVGFGLLAVALLFSSPLAIAARDVQYYRRQPAAYYFPEDFFTAAAWVRAHVPSNAPIIANHDSGLWLGAFTARTLYFGHGDETVNSAAKRPLVEQFFSSADEVNRAALLRRMGARYVWFGWLDRAAHAVPPDGTPGLTLVFRNAAASVYQFTP